MSSDEFPGLMNYPELMTSEQLADYFQTSVQALAQDRYRGYGPAFLKIGRRVRYRRADVLEYLSNVKNQQTFGHGRQVFPGQG